MLEGYEKMQPPPAWAIRKNEAIERIVKLYESLGKKDQAAPWRERLWRLMPYGRCEFRSRFSPEDRALNPRPSSANFRSQGHAMHSDRAFILRYRVRPRP